MSKPFFKELSHHIVTSFLLLSVYLCTFVIAILFCLIFDISVFWFKNPFVWDEAGLSLTVMLECKSEKLVKKYNFKLNYKVCAMFIKHLNKNSYVWSERTAWHLLYVVPVLKTLNHMNLIISTCACCLFKTHLMNITKRWRLNALWKISVVIMW